MKKSFIYIMVLTAFLSACQDENTFGPDYKPDKMGHMMKLDKADLSFSAAGGSQTIQVRAKGPHWKFEGMPDWLTISQASGIGDMTITFTATENTATDPRTATLRFMADERDFSHSKNITVRQEGVDFHTTAVSTSLAFKTDASDSPQTISVTSNEEWTATFSPADATWCTVTQSVTNGNGTVTVTVTENKTIDARSATITVKGTTSGDETKISVTQTGTKPATIATPTELPEFAASGSSQTITVTSNEEWTATVSPSDATWCTVTQSVTNGNGTVTVTVTENKTIDARSATVIVKGTTSGDETKVSLTQKGVEPYITVSPEKWTTTSADAATQTITVSSNTTWTCTSSDDTWCKVTPTSNTSATVSITANTTTKERKATLTFKAGTKEATVEVTQPGLNAEISVSPTSIEFEQTPTGSQTVTVTCNEGWKAESNATWCKVGSTTATSFTVTAETNQSFASRTATITVTSNSGKTATVTVTQKGGSIDYEDYNEDGTLSNIQAIDLGLPSGTLWANMNVGASKPEDYGDYFAWGETEPKSTYSWGTYKYCNSNRSTELTKYCTSSSYGTVDNKTVLEVADDAAAVNWGNDWRMPTITEIQELLNNTTYTWTTCNGVNGGLFTSMVNGNSIFLPAAGLRNDASFVYQSTNGYYWSASLTSRSSEAKYLYFYSESAITSDRDRSYGRSVRAVLRN